MCGRRQKAASKPSSQSAGIGTPTVSSWPSTSEMSSSRVSRAATSRWVAGKYSCSHHQRHAAGSRTNSTTRSRATRRISANPRRRSRQWWIVSTAITASNSSSANGRSSATASTARAVTRGALRDHRRRRLDGDHAPTGRLIRTRACADGRSVPERVPDRLGDARVFATMGCIAVADLVVHRFPVRAYAALLR